MKASISVIASGARRSADQGEEEKSCRGGRSLSPATEWLPLNVDSPVLSSPLRLKLLWRCILIYPRTCSRLCLTSVLRPSILSTERDDYPVSVLPSAIADESLSRRWPVSDEPEPTPPSPHLAILLKNHSNAISVEDGAHPVERGMNYSPAALRSRITYTGFADLSAPLHTIRLTVFRPLLSLPLPRSLSLSPPLTFSNLTDRLAKTLTRRIRAAKRDRDDNQILNYPGSSMHRCTGSRTRAS